MNKAQALPWRDLVRTRHAMHAMHVLRWRVNTTPWAPGCCEELSTENAAACDENLSAKASPTVLLTCHLHRCFEVFVKVVTYTPGNHNALAGWGLYPAYAKSRGGWGETLPPQSFGDSGSAHLVTVATLCSPWKMNKKENRDHG